MSYGLIDDTLWRNPKTRSFTPAEGWLWVNCISFCRERRSETGEMSVDDVTFVAAGIRIPRSTIAGLVAKHGFDATEGGFVIHGYEEIYRRSAAARRSINARWHPETRTKGATLTTTDNGSAGHTETILNQQPTTNVPVVLLKDSTYQDIAAIAEKRGAAPDSIPARLEALKQRVEGNGVRDWLRYVVAGSPSLLDQEIGRWREEDHAARRLAERDAPLPDFTSHLVRRID